MKAKIIKNSFSFILLTSFVLFHTLSFSQVQIYLVDFETAGAYTTSMAEQSDGDYDYFIRTDGADIGGTYSNQQGTYFFAAQDLDADGMTIPATLLINDIDIASYSNLELRVYLAEDDASDGNEDWDSADYVHIDYDIDNTGTFSSGIWVESSGDTNKSANIDTNNDGVGDGTEITPNFTQFTKSLTGTGSYLDIKVTFNLNSGDEDIAIDHIEIYGTSSSSPTITVNPSSLTGFTYLEGNGPSAEQSFTISGTSLTNDITVTPPTNWEISTTSGGPYQTTAITLTQSGGTVNSQSIYTRMVAGLLNANSPFSGNIVCESSGATTKNVAVDGTVTIPSNIFISEISPRGYNGDYNDEFIEIINEGSSTVDLTDWTLEYWEDGSLEENMDLTGTISANSAYVIAARSTNNLSEDFLASFTMSGASCYVILKENGSIMDEAGVAGSDEFSSSTNYEFTDCGNDNQPTANWDNLGTTGGTPGVVNCVISNDKDSDVDGPTLASQPNVSTISSLVDTDGEEIRVFDFDIYDYGTADGLPTHVTQITIKTGANNTANWATVIQAVKLSIDGGTSYVTTGAPTINASSIVIPITSGNLDINDGDAETVSLYVYLNTSGITDGEVLEFKVDGDSHEFTADASGSTFATTFTGTTPSPVSNPITIEVVATELQYATDATDTNVNDCMSPDVAVEATDANGNRDLDFTSDISITSTGSLAFSPIVVSPTSGLATFSGANCIEHSASGGPYHLVAERDGSGDWAVNSSDFNITDINACGLEEFNDGTTPPAGWTFTNIDGTYTSSSNYGNSAPSLAMDATGDIVETAPVTSPSQLSIWIKGEGTDSNSALLVEGWDGAWNTVENIIPLPTSGTIKTYTTGLSSYSKFRFSYTKSAGNLAFDDVDVTCGSCTEPTSDATALTFPTINSTSLDLSWISGNGGNRIVVCRKGATVSFTPVDNTTYSANSDYSAGIEVGPASEGNKIVYNGSASSTTVTGLEPGTTYYFEIFEYGCSGGAEDYFTTGTPAQGNETTLPENVVNFTLTCITNTTATLTWDLPSGSFDGILIAVRESTLQPSDPSCDGATLSSPDTDFSSALVYCGNTTSSKYVYNATGTSVSIIGLTSGADYVFKAFTYKGSIWTNGTQTANVASVQNVTGENTIPADQQVSVMWNNPSTCYDEIMVVAHSGGSVTQTPSGDGSSYTANSTFGAGTNMGTNDYVVYKGVQNNFDAIGLTNLTEYCFKIFTRKGIEWSSGVEICETPADVTVFKPGEFVVVGFDAKMGGDGTSTDAIYLMNFVDIKEGTTFKWVNSRFETGAAANERTMHWGGSGDEPYQDPSYLELKWQVNGQGVIDAGSIISFETDGNNLLNVRINGISNSDLILNTYQGSANVSSTEGDQMWLVQGDFTSYGTDGVDRYNLLDGTVLYGLTSIKSWVPITSAVSDDNTASGTNYGRESRLHPDLECFNIDLSLGGDDYIYYKNGIGGNPGTPLHTGTKRELLLDIQDASNWDGGLGTTSLDIDEEFIASTDTPIDDTSIGKCFSFNTGNSDGTWIGGTASYEKDWFTCKNWEGLTVPDSTMDVTIPSVSDDAPIIDHNSTKAAKFNYYAECNNLLLNDSLSLLSYQDTIFIHGNLTMQGTPVLNLDDGDATTDDGAIYLYGNYDNQVSGDIFKEGNSTFNFVGYNEQTINSDASETFYNLGINNTSIPGVKILDNITVSNTFIHTNGTLNLNGYNFTMLGEYSRTSGDFEGNNSSNFIISGSGNLDPIYFVNDLNVNEFTMTRDNEYANLMTNLTTIGNMSISSDGNGGVIFNAGNEYTIGGSLSNNGTAGSNGVIIKSDASGTASLLQTNGAVEATCERYLDANKWHMLSVPLDGVATSQLNVVSWGDTNPNFYWYDETVADFWQGAILYAPTGWTYESNVVIDNLKGYSHSAPEDRTYVLTGGKLTDGDVNINLVYSDNGTGTETITGTDWDEFEGWNTFVNPYTCAIDWEQVWASLDATEQTYIENGIYYLDNSDGSEKGRYKFYGSATMNDLGLTDNVSLDAGTQYIPANQAVFIKVTPAGNGKTITIPKTSRLHNSHGFWKNKTKPLANNTIKLSIVKDKFEDETIIRTVEGATFDHDYSIDAYKMYSWDATKPQILTRNNDNSKHFGVNSIPIISGHTVIPLVTYVGELGEYLIKNIENTFVNTHVWLEDRIENKFIKLSKSNDIYTFNQTAETNSDRFYLHFDLNHAPSTNINIPDQFTVQDKYYSYIVADNVFTDVDFADVLTFNATLTDGSELPSWLNFNPETKEFSGTPTEMQVLNIKITATDIFGASTFQEYKLTIKSPSSVFDLNEHEISIYPNPANDIIYIELPDNIKYQLSIIDITGQVLYTSYAKSQKTEVDLSKFTKGIYFVEIKSLGKLISKKIVLE